MSRQGEKEIWRQGDKANAGCRDKGEDENAVSLSPSLLVSLSAHVPC
jgi:hypothetical protein